MTKTIEDLAPDQVISDYRQKGNTYVLYGGLLDIAHSMGLAGIDTDLVQTPNEENGNIAIVKAKAAGPVNERPDGTRVVPTFSAYGDASPENVSRGIAPHLIRMAETRAKARALRDFTNLGAGVDETDFLDTDLFPDEPPENGHRTTEAHAPEEQPAKHPDKVEGVVKGGASQGGGKARRSQIDLLETLAVELRGEGGVERLEKRIGKPLNELTRREADEWIDKLTPEGRE